MDNVPDSKVHGATMGPTWVLSARDGPHVDPMNLAIRGTSLLDLKVALLLKRFGIRCDGIIPQLWSTIQQTVFRCMYLCIYRSLSYYKCASPGRMISNKLPCLRCITHTIHEIKMEINCAAAYVRKFFTHILYSFPHRDLVEPVPGFPYISLWSMLRYIYIPVAFL